MTWGIKEYKKTANANTSINGIDISEGCRPTGINNAIRQIMADIANADIDDYGKYISSDSNNVLRLGSDDKFYIEGGTPVIGNPANLISSDSGNLIILGTDSKLYVNPDNAMTITWADITDKPSSFTPSAHAATHLPGGSDPIQMDAYNVGMIQLWWGQAASIPSGWHICDGTNGTPDLRDEFVMGAASDGEVGTTGGSATASVSGNTSNVTINFDKTHYHVLEVTTNLTSTDSGSNALYVGYVSDTQILTSSIYTGSGGGNPDTASNTHRHTWSGTINTVPPYVKLYYIMYVGV